MSFFDSLFNSDLSKLAQVKYDLALKYLDDADVDSAEKYLIEAEELDPEHEDILKLRQIVEAEKRNRKNKKEELTYLSSDSACIVLWFDEFDLDKIENYTQNGYDVEQITVLDGVWYFVFRQHDDSKPKQKYLCLKALNNDTFNKDFENYYSISSFGYDKKIWFFVLNVRDDLENQAWVHSPHEFPQTEYDDWTSTDGRIEHLTEYKGSYFASASFPNPLQKYSIENFEVFPEERIHELWDDDFYIDYLGFANNKYVLNYAKNPKLNDQGYYTSKDFPSKFMLETMTNGYNIQHLYYAQSVWQVIYTKTQVSAEEETSGQSSDTDDHQIYDEEPISTEVRSEKPEVNEEELKEALKELDSLIGLVAVKNEIRLLTDYLRIGRIKEESGLKNLNLNLHMVFSGNPGTGKTTVARLIGKIFRALGLLTKGHVVETDRSGLVAEFIGKTAIKTKEKIEESKGGILFVDEAYALHKVGKGDFGHEAMETLLKQMEDHRDDFCVILAGYTEEMDELLESNPGLKSRFATHLRFKNFTGIQLMSILKKMLLKANHQLKSSTEEKALKYLEYLSNTADRYFGNARAVRNLFEDLLKNQSSRLAAQVSKNTESQERLSIEDLRTIKEKDLEKCYAFQYEEQKEQTLEDVMAEIDELVGLNNIKDDIKRLAQFLKVQQKRRDKGLENQRPNLHSVFLGPPGTGKTTIARMLAKVYKSLGIIKKEKLVEASRSDLVAGYVGQTAIKTNKLIDKALHGILFIDEAYALTSGNDNDFGHEAVETLLKRMEDDREILIVIVAGYDEEMKKFVGSNPGLESRFNRRYHFKTYSNEELEDIFLIMVKKSHYELTDDAQKALYDIIKMNNKANNSNFGNARWVRNFFEHCKIEQAQRICKESYIDEGLLTMINHSDLEKAQQQMKNEDIFQGHRNRIGF